MISIIHYISNPRKREKNQKGFNINKEVFKKLIYIGTPSGIQLGADVLIFTIIGILAAKIGTFNIAAHYILLMTTSLIYMLPSGLSSAAAIRVAYFYGKNDFYKAKKSGWISIKLTIFFMAIISGIFWLSQNIWIYFFTIDLHVIKIVSSIIIWTCLVMIFDALQVVFIGALRGLSNTVIGLYSNIFSHYFIGLPIGIILCFGYDFKLTGLWIGICIAQTSACILVSKGWITKTKANNFTRKGISS